MCASRPPRILQAGAQLGITRADQFPTVTAGAAALNERIPRTLAQPAVNTSASQGEPVGCLGARFLGKVSTGDRVGARQFAGNNEWARQAVISTLVSDVASA